MTYDVRVTDRAERQLNDAADWIAKSAPAAADRWFNGFVAALRGLKHNPERCGLAHENPMFSYELRQLLYGRRRNYRALFTVRGNIVVVLAIRHSAQPDVTPDDFFPE
jgi:plasmid stabilization system protein ParE